MTTTLVLGGPHSGRTRHAEALLAASPAVTRLATAQTPELARALLAARQPVLVDDLAAWLRGVLDADDLWRHAERARLVVDERLDEVIVTLRGLPFDVVVVSTEAHAVRLPDVPSEELYVDLLARVNQRLSAAASHVHAIVAGRVLDLSAAPPPGGH